MSNDGFFGNPLCNITDIDTTGGIEKSRSGTLLTPAFIQVSAKNITATGTSPIGIAIDAYEELEFRWDFGDPSGTEEFYQPIKFTTAGPKYEPFLVNMNDEQYGPEAAYCYRSAAGSPYTITLYIRGKTASGYITDSVTTTVTVAAWSGANGDRYVDSQAYSAGTGTGGNDAWDGTAPVFVSGTTGPKQSLASIRTFITSNRRINLALGSTWSQVGDTGWSAIDIGSSPVNLRVRSYDPGDGRTAKPILQTTPGTGSPTVFQILNSGTPSDHVWSDIEFRSTNTNGSARIINFRGIQNFTNLISDLYLDNVDATRTVEGNGGGNGIQFDYAVALGSPPPNFFTFLRGGIWGGNCIMTLVATKADIAFFGGAAIWQFVYGMYCEGAGTGGVGQSHHMYTKSRQHIVFKYNRFGPTNPLPEDGNQRFYCIKQDHYTDADTALNVDPSRWTDISDNDMQYTSTSAQICGSSSGSGHANDAYGPTHTYSRNAMHGHSNHQLVQIGIGAETVTVRDCISWGHSNANDFLAYRAGAETQTQTYRNKMKLNGVNSPAAFYFDDPSDIGDVVLPQLWAYNEVWNLSSSGNAIWGGLSDLVTTGSYVDHNVWCMAKASPFIDDDQSGRSYATWRSTYSFDDNSSTTQPEWLDPDAGDFRTEDVGGGNGGGDGGGGEILLGQACM